MNTKIVDLWVIRRKSQGKFYAYNEVIGIFESRYEAYLNAGMIGGTIEPKKMIVDDDDNCYHVRFSLGNDGSLLVYETEETGLKLNTMKN